MHHVRMTTMSRPSLRWEPSVLPGGFGHPCEQLRLGKRIARVWQASRITARGAWCWSIDSAPVSVTRGNKGSAKGAAKKALVRPA